MEFSYEHFVECLVLGDQRIFSYLNYIIVVETSKDYCGFIVEQLGKRILKQTYKDVHSLLERAKVDGKTLKELWNKLILV